MRSASLTWSEDSLLSPEARTALTGPGAPFEMVEEDVLGTPMRVFARRPRSMRAVLEGAADRLGDQPFLVFPDRAWSYRAFLVDVSSMAAALADRFGVGPGSRVAISAANCPGHALAAWAAVCLGASVVELNGWWTGAEMEHGLGLTRPAVLLGDRARLDRLTGAPSCPTACVEDDLDELLRAGEGRSLPAVRIDEDDPLCILFTSGTTGRPKGAVLSHRGHAHQMMQAALQGQVGSLLEPASSQPGPAPARVSLGVAPMFHVSGFTNGIIGAPLIGMTIVFPAPGRWDPDVHLEMTQRHRVTSWTVVPTQLWRLVEHPRLDEYDLSSLRRVGGGGATYAPELWRQVSERLPGIERMGTGYGMTETCGAGTHQDGRAAASHPEAVGAPVPGYSIRVCSADGFTVEEGSVGEIQLRGPCNLLGYFDQPDATAAALTEDRWYRTGELGHISEGLLYLDGRGADLIIRAGENVYPIEIENRLIEHPAVAEAAVIGRPDRVLGEVVKAVVVLHPGHAFDVAEMRDWVGRELAAFKVPEELDVVDELPHNAAGKVIKHELRQVAAR